VATATEDARPPRTQPREIGADHVLLVSGIEEFDPLAGKVQRNFTLGHLPSVRDA
jgi:hypothetical protein